MSDNHSQKYRGGRIIKYTFLKGKCEICNSPSTHRIERENNNPPQGYIRGGSIVSEYCDEHCPEEVKLKIQDWYEFIKNPP